MLCVHGAPNCCAQEDTGLGGLCFPMSQKRDMGHPAVMLKEESRSFVPLTPLRGAPNCPAFVPDNAFRFTDGMTRTRVFVLSSGQLRPLLLSLVDQPDGFQEDVAVDGEAVGADLVHGVLRGVVVAVVRAVVEIDDVDGRARRARRREGGRRRRPPRVWKK